MKRIIIASGPVIVENKKVLLNKHGEDNFWKFCGGKVKDFDTSLIECARREAREEMGIELDIANRKPFVMHVLKKTPEGEEIDVLLVHYEAKRIGEISPGTHIREWGWFHLDDFPEDIAENIPEALLHFNHL